MIQPELNSLLFVLFLSYCNEKGLAEVRNGID